MMTIYLYASQQILTNLFLLKKLQKKFSDQYEVT